MDGIDFWKNEKNEVTSKKDLLNSPHSDKFLGGEVTNETAKGWLISGGSNSNPKDFKILPPYTNSDDFKWVETQLGGDVDAVWPAGNYIKNYETGEKVNSGAFKLSDIRNTNIIYKNGEFIIYDFTQYFKDSELPSGWELPKERKNK